MKKAIAILVVLTIALCFSGCGDKKKDKKTADKTSSVKKSEGLAETMELSLKYDDFYELEGAKSVKSSNTDVIKAAKGNLHAVGISESPVDVTVTGEDGKKTVYKVTVSKAKINIAIVAGQSNASGETSGVPETAAKYTSAVCKQGTAYIWGANSIPTALGGAGSYDGFRSAYAAEWYEQSLKAGDPQKTVVVFANNYTATPGEKVDEWLSGNTEKGSLKKTADMLNACYDYYESGKGSAFFEISGCGMYWLQGESDRRDTFSYYYGKFNTLWSQFKSATKNRVKYCAFMRVRASYESDSGLELGGPVLAQYKLANDFDDIYMATTLTETLTGSLKTPATVDVSNYNIFGESQYSQIVSENTLSETQGNIYGGLHYSRLGYNIIGADAAYNMYRALHASKDTATLVNENGERVASVAFGETASVSADKLASNLYVYKDSGSSGNKVSLKVISGGADITSTAYNSGTCFINGGAVKTSGTQIILSDGSKSATFKIS